MSKHTSVTSKPQIVITITNKSSKADHDPPRIKREPPIPHKEIGTLVSILQRECSRLMRTPVDFVPRPATGVIQFVGTPRTDTAEALATFASGAPMMLKGLEKDIRDTALMLELPLEAHRDFGRIEVQACASTTSAEGLRLNRQSGKLEATRNDWEALYRRFSTAAANLSRLRTLAYGVQVVFDGQEHWLAAPTRDALRRHLVPGGTRTLFVQVSGLMPHESLCSFVERGSALFDVEIQRPDCNTLKQAWLKDDTVRIEVSEQVELNPLLPEARRFTLLKVEVYQGQLAGIDGPADAASRAVTAGNAGKAVP